MIDYPVNIRGIKRYVTDKAGKVPIPQRLQDTGKRIAVVGGGPCGLTAAYCLSLMGHNVTIFERRQKLGGMLRYGIPSYRLPRERLDAEIEAVLSTGIEVKTGVANVSVEDLRKGFDAVCMAFGAHGSKSLGIKGEDSIGVISAVELLGNIGDGIMPDFSGKTVIVAGGGNVAMDAARSAVRLGAKKVVIAYRIRKADMTALPDEIEEALAEGCEILELKSPVSIESDEDGNVTALWVKPQMIGQMKYGRPNPQNAKAELERIPCGAIVSAIGQSVENANLAAEKGVIRTSSDCGIKGMPGVFAGGDCVSGPATAIKAIAAGKAAASNIDAFLGYSHQVPRYSGVPKADIRNDLPCGRVNLGLKSVSERLGGFEPIELGMSDEEALQETGRCLRCDCCGMASLRAYPKIPQVARRKSKHCFNA
jgi:NADPH-dependent glutamate synthase beta subunit-like oxidoreductase